MGLLSDNAIASGRATFDGDPLFPISSSALNRIRGNQLSIIFQDPFGALNPYRKIGVQMSEVLVHHQGSSMDRALQESIAMLQGVKLPGAKALVEKYPHELSGGMQQRVLIAMSLLCRPKLLIADEPTTALDVTTQASIVELLKGLQKDFQMSVVFISHDLGVISNIAEEVIVFYAGQLLEMATTEAIFLRPRHPYTQALLQSAPKLERDQTTMHDIAGEFPQISNQLTGCRFEPRCRWRKKECAQLNISRNTPLSSQDYCACPFSI